MSFEALLSRTSLTEKIGQLNHVISAADTTGASSAVSDIESRIRRGEVGTLPGGHDLARLRALQKIAIEESPQRIPLIFTLDVIHGHRTIFPLPLGLACTWDAALIERTARVAAVEATGAGIPLAWAPMLDASRDARWGRCAESPGEAPVLGAVVARAMVKGCHNPLALGDHHDRIAAALGFIEI
jgi:beta-glucosidase